ncbi:serum response factor homolog A-like [Hermetia illucens]|uniref:serum response factor homolog A-like n=1 Tax=Hermetia illucens TaxID=343691 RepID=UPI0018CC771E|nr:serum response factor homolog A-like [Hermetia illucens]
MSAKRSKVIPPGEMSSEEEGSTGPEDNGGTLGLQKEIADLKSEKAAMEQQLECQQLLIKQLQVQLASLEEKVRAGTASAQLKPRQQLEQRQHQLPSQQQHQQPSQQQHQQPSQQQHQQPSQQQQNEQHQEAIEMDIVGSPASYPEVIIDEGDPFNFVRRRNKATKNKRRKPTNNIQRINDVSEDDVGPELPMQSDNNDFEKQHQMPTEASAFDEMRAKYDDVL